MGRRGGHAQMQTTMIYVHHIPQHDAADRLTWVYGRLRLAAMLHRSAVLTARRRLTGRGLAQADSRCSLGAKGPECSQE